jgi:hypothetical protein
MWAVLHHLPLNFRRELADESFQLATRLFTAVYYVVIYVFLPMLRPFLVMSIVAIIIPGALWIGSIFLEEPNRQALIWIAILLGMASSILRHRLWG